MRNTNLQALQALGLSLAVTAAACDQHAPEEDDTRVTSAPLSAAAMADDPEAGRTSHGEAIIGFVPGWMPLLTVGDRLFGYPIVRVVAKGNFLVVRADDLLALADDLFRLVGVAYVEDNAHLFATYVPNDTSYYRQYGPELMGFESAWDTTLGSTAVIVAVLDSGLQESHADLAGTAVADGYDFVNRDGTPDDRCGHGTHVAGTIAATMNNGRGVAGLARVTILPHKVLDVTADGGCSGSTAGIAEAIYAARDAGAKVINMSLGAESGSTTLRNAVDDAAAKGILVVVAAGNDYGGPVNYPAAYASAIAVTAIDADKALADYSNVGSQVDVTAPGSDILSTYNNGGYAWASGTSMATPHVASALALAASCAPGASAATLRDRMYATAEDLGAAGRDNAFGYGLVRADRLVAALCQGPGTPEPEPEPEPIPTLRNGEPVSVTVASGEERHYQIAVPTGATRLEVAISGGSGDADLYVRRGAQPTDATYDCRPYLEGNAETCTFEPPAAGTYYVRVRHYSGTPTVTLVAAWSAPGTVAAPIVITTLPFHHESTTAGAASDGWNSYACAPGTNEGGPEVVYRVTLDVAGTLTAAVSDGNGVDVDVHLLSAPDAGACLDRDDTEVAALLDPGTYYVVVDTYVSDGVERAGPYALDVSFAPDPGEPPPTGGDPDPGADTLDNGQQVSLTVAAGQERFFKIAVPSGAADLVFVTDGPGCGLLGCSASIDLYARQGARPTDGAYDCRPGNGDSDERCAFAAPAPGWWYARIKGVRGTTSLTLRAAFAAPSTTPPPDDGGDPPPVAPGVITLTNGQPVSVSLSETGATADFALWVPAGESALEVVTDGPGCGLFGCAFDADLYLRRGAKATTTSHDCKSESSGSDESCAVGAPASDWWYVHVRSYSGGGSITLEATAD